MAPERRQALHYQRRRPYLAGAGPLRGRHDRRPGAVDVRVRPQSHGGQGAPHREQARHQGVAYLRARVHERAGRVGRRPQDGAHQIRDVADERCPSGYRCPVDRSFGGRLPRSAQVCAGAHAVRQADHRVPGRGRDAVEHESQTLRFARDAVRDDAFRRDIQGLYSPEP